MIPGSPAARAGLAKGDIIIKMGKERIQSPDQLVSEIRNHKVGEKVEIEYLRSKARRRATITLDEMPPNTP
ncbi:MAG: PDZ domain-containing protein [Armatimonadetes bacterium]|nr:PDZ domain-containing protein [Armatimonadota bacterium]